MFYVRTRPLRGVEPDPLTTNDHHNLDQIENQGGAESGALDSEGVAFDPRLQMIIDAWPTLSELSKDEIYKILNISKSNGH